MRTQTIPLVVALLFLCSFVSAQQPDNPAEISPHTRLMAARSIYIEHSGASIPYDIIGDAFQGWGRYQMADTPASADLIVSIIAPSSAPRASAGPGGKDRPAPTDELTQIRLLILDAHDRAVLWSSSEQPKAAFNQKHHEDQLVDASLRLFRRFRNIIEPEPAP
jgi:hypothetical protein